jgi:hypothetical protein
MKKATNYVIAVDFVSGQTLEESCLLGWNNKYDWFDCETGGDEILTPAGGVQKNEWGLITINNDVTVYVGETESECKDYSDRGNREGYDCTVCKIEQVNDELVLIPV